MKQELATAQSLAAKARAQEPPTVVIDPAITAELQSLKSANQSSADELARVSSELDRVTRELSESKVALSAAHSRIERLLSDVAAAEATLSASTADFIATLSSERAIIQELRAKCSTAEAQCGTLQAELETLKAAAAVEKCPITQPPLMSVIPLEPEPVPLAQHTVIDVASDVPSSSGGRFSPNVTPLPSVRARAGAGSHPPFPPSDDTYPLNKPGQSLIGAKALLIARSFANDPKNFLRSETGLATIYFLSLHILLALLIRGC